MSATRRKPYQRERTSTEELLDTSPFGGDPDVRPVASRRRRGMSRVTMALGAGVILMAGVIIGIQAQKSFGAAAGARGGTVTAGPDGAARAAGGTAPGRRDQGGFDAGGGAAAGNATVGTVQRIEGDTIYVETAQGETVAVRTSAGTRIQVTKAGKVTDLEQGGRVVVQGERSDDGTVEATAVSQGGAGFRVGFGGGRRDGGGRGGAGGGG